MSGRNLVPAYRSSCNTNAGTVTDVRGVRRSSLAKQQVSHQVLLGYSFVLAACSLQWRLDESTEHWPGVDREQLQANGCGTTTTRRQPVNTSTLWYHTELVSPATMATPTVEYHSLLNSVYSPSRIENRCNTGSETGDLLYTRIAIKLKEVEERGNWGKER